MTIRLFAPAKLNLTLEVLGKRPDGYHDIRSVLQTIDLCDTLSFTPANQIDFSCTVPELASEDNLVVRAARSLKAATGYEGGAAIHLEKRIPEAAGLGGGSSDAATTLKGLARLWGIKGLPLRRLVEIGTQLGMDVPFFLYDGTALAQGRGEIVTPLPPLPTTWFVLLHPPIAVPGKTTKGYGSMTSVDYTAGGATSRLVGALQSSTKLEDSLLFNVFESVADRIFASIDAIRHRFEMIAARPIHLAGAGPTLFCLTADNVDSVRLRDQLILEGFEAYSCVSLATGRDSQQTT